MINCSTSGKLLLEGSAPSVGPNRQVAASAEEREWESDQAEQRSAEPPQHGADGDGAGERDDHELGWTHRDVGDVERVGEPSPPAASVDDVVGERRDTVTDRGA